MSGGAKLELDSDTNNCLGHIRSQEKITSLALINPTYAGMLKT